MVGHTTIGRGFLFSNSHLWLSRGLAEEALLRWENRSVQLSGFD